MDLEDVRQTSSSDGHDCSRARGLKASHSNENFDGVCTRGYQRADEEDLQMELEVCMEQVYNPSLTAVETRYTVYFKVSIRVSDGSRYVDGSHLATYDLRILVSSCVYCGI